MSWVKEELCTLLDLLSSDLNYDNIRKAKDKLKDLIENKEAQAMWFSPICTGDSWKIADDRKILYDLKHSSGCLLAGLGRGDCEHFVGLPGKSVPGIHDGKDDTVDAYGRPNGWCEVCWRGEQIKRLHKQISGHKETIIEQAIHTEEGRKQLAAAMTEPMRTVLEYGEQQ